MMIAALARSASLHEHTGRGVALAAASLASFLVVFDDSAVSVALPSLQRDLGLGMDELEWTLNAYSIGIAAVLLLAGKLVDRVGPQRPLLFGIALFALASVPAALTGSSGVLIAARAVQGVGAGFIAPASLALIGTMFSAARRGLAIGIWAGLSAVGLGAGPLLGAAIVDYIGWSGLFLLNIPSALFLIATFSSRPFRSSLPAPRRSLDIAGAAAGAASLVFVLLLLTRGGSDGWTSLPVVALAVALLVSAAVFVAVEARAVDPVLPLGVLRSRELTGAMAVGLVSTAAMCSLFFFLSLYLQTVSGYGILAVGAVFLPMTAVVAVGAPVAGLVGNRVPPHVLAAIGMAVISAAMLLLARLDTGLSIGGIVLGLALAGGGVAMTATPVTALALATLPPTSQGLAGALVSTARTVGLALGVAVMGAILGSADGDALSNRLSFGLKVNAIIAAVGALVAVALLRPSSTRSSRAATLVANRGDAEGGA